MSYQREECDCGRISGSMFGWPEESNVNSLIFRAEAARGSKNYDEALTYYDKARMLLGQGGRQSCCGYKVGNSITNTIRERDAARKSTSTMPSPLTAVGGAVESMAGCAGFLLVFAIAAGVITFFVRRGVNPRSTVYAFAGQAWPVIIVIAVICLVILALALLYAFIKDRMGK